MNKLFFLFILLLCIVTASCSDDTPCTDEAEISFWDNPHLAFVGLKGAVSKIVETDYALSEDGDSDDESQVISEMHFNATGKLTYYNPTGMQPQTRGVWQTLAYYTYQYDATGKMTTAIVTEIGGGLVEYTLKYGEHSCYIPLIFPLGPIDFFLIKGLQSIVSSDGSVSYQFDGKKASYMTESWEGTTETVFEFEQDNIYPVKKLVTTSRGGEVLKTESSEYTYALDGNLSSIDRKVLEQDIESERTIIRYVNNEFLLLSSKRIDAGGMTFDYTYTYGSDKLLQKVMYVQDKGTADELTTNEEYVYLSLDNSGNWIDSKQTLSSLVDWAHPDGTIGVRREIIY